MRVISGSAKGKKLATVKGTGIRPTADKVKMAYLMFFSMVSLILILKGAAH